MSFHVAVSSIDTYSIRSEVCPPPRTRPISRAIARSLSHAPYRSRPRSSRPLVHVQVARCSGGSFARISIGRSGTGAAALAEASKLEAAAEGEDAKQEVRRQKEAVEQKARGAATHPHRSCPPPRTRPIACAVTALPPLAAAFALFALPARAGEGVPQHPDAQLTLLHLGRRGGPAAARRDFRTKNAVFRRQVWLERHRSARARPQRRPVLGSLVLRGRSHHQQGRVVRGRDRPSRCPRRGAGEQVGGDRDAAVGSQWPPHEYANQERVHQPPTSAKERQASSRCCCGCAGRQDA